MVKPHQSQIKAGKIAARVLKEIKDEVKPGVTALRICTMVEKRIMDYGASPAFPCNVNINHVAAHHSSPRKDPTKIPDFGLVKIDVGVHIDGYIADTAATIDVDGTLEGFVAATDDALAEAIAMIEPGVKLGAVGEVIERIIKVYGLRTIKNLSGHSIKRYRLHADKIVPNTKKRIPDVVELGDCLAIEPYATTGTGMVKDTDFVYVLQNTGRKIELDGTAEKLRVFLNDRYGPMPFSPRWIGATKGVDVVEALKELLRTKAIRGIPVQVERKARPVSHSEHTIFVSDDGVQVLTLPD